MNKKEYQKQYRATHKKEIAEWNKQYRKDHLDQIKAYNKQYQQNHKEELNSYNRKRTNSTKAKIVALHGGKCAICGYSKCLAALDFHHVNPEDKDTTVITEEEAEKCILLCSNCHREYHSGAM